ncbi:MAG: hypothetical protein M1831_004990 [Alyxoria varia]|nr:MAG: hypothetical protein M1831_004990 [Alyxoria varia]
MPITNLYGFGSNGSGQLGLGHSDDVATPQLCEWGSTGLSNASIRSIAAGGNHTLVLDEDGQVWAAGDPNNGRCGKGDMRTRNEAVFERVCFSDELGSQVDTFDLVAATWEASTFVTNSGKKAFSCGAGGRGELALSSEVSQAPAARMIPDFPPPDTRIVDIAGSMGHTVAVLSNGDCYGWGNGRERRLGEPSGIIWTPRKIEKIPFEVARAVCGKDFTCLAGSPDSGQHVVLGNDKWGVRSSAPDLLPRWKQIGASWGGIHVLGEDGKMLSWGRNDHGQLAPNGLPVLTGITVGSEHVIAKATDDRILAWGWGEHGNCGIEDETQDAHSRGWNVIDVRGSPVVAGAGCATSFLAANVNT